MKVLHAILAFCVVIIFIVSSCVAYATMGLPSSADRIVFKFPSDGKIEHILAIDDEGNFKPVLFEFEENGLKEGIYLYHPPGDNGYTEDFIECYIVPSNRKNSSDESIYLASIENEAPLLCYASEDHIKLKVIPVEKGEQERELLVPSSRNYVVVVEPLEPVETKPVIAESTDNASPIPSPSPSPSPEPSDTSTPRVSGDGITVAPSPDTSPFPTVSGTLKSTKWLQNTTEIPNSIFVVIVVVIFAVLVVGTQSFFVIQSKYKHKCDEYQKKLYEVESLKESFIKRLDENLSSSRQSGMINSETEAILHELTLNPFPDRSVDVERNSDIPIKLINLVNEIRSFVPVPTELSPYPHLKRYGISVDEGGKCNLCNTSTDCTFTLLYPESGDMEYAYIVSTHKSNAYLMSVFYNGTENLSEFRYRKLAKIKKSFIVSGRFDRRDVALGTVERSQQ
jgi:hypothetical protein